MIHIKHAHELKAMRESGRLLAEVLEEIKSAIAPGVNLKTLDELACSEIAKRNVRSSFKGYTAGGALLPFPAYLCASVNNEIIHAPATRDIILREGDIVGLDIGLNYKGWHADMAETVAVGIISDDAQRLLDATREALSKGIAAAMNGVPLNEISKAIYNHIESSGFGTVETFVGHGIGRAMHEDPAVPNYPTKSAEEIILKTGMVLALEPMVTLGKSETRVADDGWTAKTADNSLAAHFEHTVAITDKGPEILTSFT